METRITGPTYGDRQASAHGRHTYQMATTAQASAIVLPNFPTIQASTSAPVILTAQVCVSTADGGTTPTISFGVTSTATELISAASVATAAAGGTFLPASNAVGKYRITADTQIYYKTAAGNDGAGVVTLILDMAEVNTKTT